MAFVMLVEAVIVGAFGRRGNSAILAGAIVWAAVGFMLMELPVIYGYASGDSLVVPLALQGMLTGMSAVVLADFFSETIAARWMIASPRTIQHQRLRKYSFHAFVLVALLPAVLLSTGAVLIIGQRQEAEGGVRLRDSAQVLSGHIEAYLGTHAQAMEALAATIARVADSASERQLMLEQYAGVYSGFIAWRLADPDGDVHTLVPPLADTSDRLSVLDRKFFADAMRTHQTAISDVVMGQLTRVPMVFIATPWLAPDGAVAGVAYGVLNLSKFRQVIEGHQAIPDATIVILDQHNRVISASDRSSYVLEQDLSDSELVRASRDAPDGIYQYTPKAGNRPLPIEVVGVGTIAIADWKVFVAQPRLGMRLQSERYYAFTLALIALALGGAVLVARTVQRHRDPPARTTGHYRPQHFGDGDPHASRGHSVRAGGNRRPGRRHQPDAVAPGRLVSSGRADARRA